MKLKPKYLFLKSGKVLVLVKGMSIHHEQCSYNMAGISWFAELPNGELFRNDHSRYMDGVLAFKTWAISLGYTLPDDFGTLLSEHPGSKHMPGIADNDEINYGFPGLRVNGSVLHITHTKPDNDKLKLSFHTGISHKDYHYAISNAVKLMQYLESIDK